MDLDLWNNRWIPVVMPDGTRQRVSLVTALCEGHHIHDVAVVRPNEEAGLRRFLTAVAQAVASPQTLSDVRALLQAGRFEERDVIAFGAQMAGRFDLAHTERPFLQWAAWPVEPTPETEDTARLWLDWPSGTRLIWHQDALRPGHTGCCPACAAIGLMSLSAWTTMGGGGLGKGVNGDPPIYVMPLGRTLAETLILSLVPGANSPEDQPAWDRQTLLPKEPIQSLGYLHALTFQPRAVRLYPEVMPGFRCSRCGELSDVGIRRMRFGAGERSTDRSWRDPFVIYSEKGGPMRYRLDSPVTGWEDWIPARTFDAPPGKKGAFWTAPAIVTQLRQLEAPERLRVLCAAVSQATWIFQASGTSRPTTARERDTLELLNKRSRSKGQDPIAFWRGIRPQWDAFVAGNGAWEAA